MDRPLLSGTLGPPLVNSCSEEGASVPITPVGPVGLLHCIQNVLIGVATIGEEEPSGAGLKSSEALGENSCWCTVL